MPHQMPHQMPRQMPTELSRADLLRVLHRAPGVPAASVARLLGWDRHEARGPDIASPPVSTGRTVAAVAGTPVRYLTRPAPVYWHLIGCEPLVRQAETDRQDAPTRVEPEAAAGLGSGPAPDPRIAPLLDAGQWQNLWDRLPPSPRRGRAIDLRASLRRLARAEPLRDLPRWPRRGFNRAVTLLLDHPAALRPVWDDMRLARRSLAALLGDDLQTFHLPAGPDGPWFEAGGAGQASVARPPAAKAGPGQPQAEVPEPGPEAIARGSPVVLIGAFGALDSAEIAPDWQRLLARLRAAGHPLLLVPVCPLRQSALPVVPLDPAVGHADRDAADRALETLLAALSQTWLPTPARLRQLRRAIPGADLHTELRTYNAQDIARDGFHLWLTPDRLWVWLNRFAELSDAQRGPLWRLIDAWRRGLDAGAQAIERLQADLLAPGRPDDYPGIEQQVAEVAAALDGPHTMDRAQLASMLPVLLQLDAWPDPSWRPVLRDAHRLARAIGLGAIADADAADDDVPSHTLIQRGADLVVLPRGRPERLPGPGGISDIGPRAYSLETGRLVDGAPLTGLRTLTVIDRGHRWHLATAIRPRWAERIWSDGGNLYAAHADNAILRWQPAAPDRPDGAWQPEHDPWPWAAGIGADRFGLWALLKVRGVPYRLRWIPAGRFLMGSPPEEPGREDNETQHEVTLNHGFWLGETAVPQALWRAVMGGNPSYFQGDDLPVERVSWDDCRVFLGRANGRRDDGLVLRLPTEAEWELACRAGTRTAFSFGEALDPGRANYDGSYSYNNGPKGQYRRRTLPVRSLAPNPWGLYQMHGNVWEWCADRYGGYPGGPVSDPAGAADGTSRVLRGGSWNDYGRYLRSAYRYHYSPDDRHDYIGLRLAGGVDRHARQAGQSGGGAVTDDGRERSDRPVGGQGAGGVAVSPSRQPEPRPKPGLLREWMRRLGRGDKS